MKKCKWVGFLSLFLVMVFCLPLTVRAAEVTDPAGTTNETGDQNSIETPNENSTGSSDGMVSGSSWAVPNILVVSMITDEFIYTYNWGEDFPDSVSLFQKDGEVYYTVVQSIEEGEALPKGSLYFTQEEFDGIVVKAQPCMQSTWQKEYYNGEGEIAVSVVSEFRQKTIDFLVEFVSTIHKSGEAVLEEKPSEGDQNNQSGNPSDSNTSSDSTCNQDIILGSDSTCVNKNGVAVTAGLVLKQEELAFETEQAIYPLLQDIIEKDIPGFKTKLHNVYIADSATNEQLTLKGSAQILLSYPDGYGKDDKYRVYHWNEGEQKWEKVDFSAKDAGLECTVTSLSPFAIAYTEADHSGGSSSGSSGSSSASGSSQTPVPGSQPLTNVPKTGEAFPVAELLLLALGIAICGKFYSERRKHV